METTNKYFKVFSVKALHPIFSGVSHGERQNSQLRHTFDMNQRMFKREINIFLVLQGYPTNIALLLANNTYTSFSYGRVWCPHILK